MRATTLARCRPRATPRPRISFIPPIPSRHFSYTPIIDYSVVRRTSDSYFTPYEEVESKSTENQTNIKDLNSILSQLESRPSTTNYSLISTIPSDTICNYAALNHAMRWSDDSASILHLTRLVVSSSSSLSVDLSSRLISQTVRKLGKHHLIAGLPCLVDLFCHRIEVALTKDVIGHEAIQDNYALFLKALYHFAGGNSDDKSNTPLGVAGRSAVLDTVRHLIKVLERLPSSSTVGIALDNKVLRWIAIQRVFTPELGQIVEDYAQRTGTALSPKFWDVRFMIAVQQNDTAAAKESLRRIKEAQEDEVDKLKPPSTPVQTEDGDNEMSMEALQRTTTWAQQTEEQAGHHLVPSTGVEDAYNEDMGVSPLWAQRFDIDNASLAPTLEPSKSYESQVAPRMPILAARLGGQPFHKFAETLAPYLRELPATATSTAIETQRYAWCMLFHTISRQPSSTPADIYDLYLEMPPTAICAYTLTPIMQALLRLGNTHLAWKVWQNSLALEKADSSTRYVDAVSLSVATDICYRMTDLDTAIQLVDRHATRPGAKGKEEDIKIDIDVTNVNILLTLCVKARAPSIALRIWAASLPRWGVHLDGISLTLILDVSRFCELDVKPDQWVEDFGTRFRLLMDEFSLRKKKSQQDEDERPEEYRAYEDDGFSKGGYQVLLDPPGHQWYTQFGTYRPWQRTRHIFREVVLHNWPFLRDLKSPLETAASQSRFDFLSDLFGSTLHHHHHHHHQRPHIGNADIAEQEFLARTATPELMQSRLPEVNARYFYIVPGASTWHAYISVLGVFNQVAEIPLALVWMRALGVEPSWNCLTSALTFIGEVEGPKRRIKDWNPDGSAKFVRDEEIMRRWLVEWLGEERVPSEEDVMANRRFIMERGWKLIL